MPKMSKKAKETAFIVGFVAYMLILYLNSSKLSSASKAFPFAVMGVSAFVIVLKLLTYLFPKLKFLDPSGEVGKKREVETSVDNDILPDEPEGEHGAQPHGSRLFTVFLFIVWLATFPCGMYLIGFLPTLFIWLMIFMLGLSRLKVTLALPLTVGTFAVLYALFGLLLKLNFGHGILF